MKIILLKLATNKVDYSKVSNESIISHIYYQLLGQNIYETNKESYNEM